MSGAEEWDFYYCRVDDAPASIFLNFGYRTSRPAGLDTLYFVGFEMLVPGEHGMGEEPDVAQLWGLEDEVIAAAAAAGFTYVGRLRNRGDWQLTFYAKAGKQDELEQLVVARLGESPRGYRVGSQRDEPWEYYEDFLLPDAERFQWIMDRRVVHQLAQAGDELETPRPVDHFVDFADAARRDRFIAKALELGFEGQVGRRDSDGDRHPVQLTRTDPVTLDHIHEVVMRVIELAEQHDGIYDGWGAPIARSGG